MDLPSKSQPTQTKSAQKSQPTQAKNTQPSQKNPHQNNTGGESGGSGGGKGAEGFMNLANMGLICIGICIAPKGENIGIICTSTEFGKGFSLSNVNLFIFGFQSASFMPPFIQEMASKMMDMHAGTPQGQLVDPLQLPESAGASAAATGGAGGTGGGAGGSGSDAPPVSFSTPRSTASGAMSAGSDRAFNKFPSIPTLQVKSAGRISKMELGALVPDHTPHVSSGRGTQRVV